MTLNVKEIQNKTSSNKKDFGRLEDGPALARIVSIIDLGNQDQTDWQTGEATKPQDKAMITFETPDECITYEKDGEEITAPRWISKEYTISMNDKAALYKLIMSLDPELGDLGELLNVPCQITIGSTSGNKAKIIGVSKPMKGSVVGELKNDSFHFDFSNPDMAIFNNLPQWIQDKIKDANDYNGFADKEEF